MRNAKRQYRSANHSASRTTEVASQSGVSTIVQSRAVSQGLWEPGSPPGNSDAGNNRGNHRRHVDGQDPSHHRGTAHGAVSLDTSASGLHPESQWQTAPARPTVLVRQTGSRGASLASRSLL